MGTAQATAPAPQVRDAREYVLERYDKRIDYYWDASRNNKRSYKTTRNLLIVLGAIVTLISSLSRISSKPAAPWPSASPY